MRSTSFKTADEIAQHPKYVSARNIYIEKHIEIYSREILANRVLVEAARIILFSMVICQHAGFDLERRETWPTVGGLREMMEGWGLASPRQIEHLIARLIQTGYIYSRPCPRDRRAKLLEPTAKMLAYDQAWLAAYYAPLHHLYPDGPYAAALTGDPAFQLAQRRIALANNDHGVMMMASHPATVLFMMRSSGQIILLELLRAAQAEPADASYITLAQRCGVSRTHVRGLLEEGETAGLVRLTGRGGRQVEVLPTLWTDFDRFNAEAMSTHDRICREALTTLGAPVETPSMQVAG